MKLRAYTPEETDHLLSKFMTIANYAYKSNAAAYDIMYKRYEVYLKNFGWSLFKWKPLSFDEFTQKLNCWDKPRFQHHIYRAEYDSTCIFSRTFFKEEANFFRGTSWCWNYYSDFMVKHGCDKLTDEEQKILSCADSVVENFVHNYDLKAKYRALVKYAHQPFEFDESDIPWLERIDNLYNKAIEWNSN